MSVVKTVNPDYKTQKTDQEIVCESLAAAFAKQTQLVSRMAKMNRFNAAQDEHEYAGRILQVWAKNEDGKW